ncbi:MAG: signal peptidase II [Bacteroidales bacterium]|nr:signal peptidase II [Bacteroidales bacterium]
MKRSEGRKLVILGIVLVVIDQIIKVLVKTNMGLGEHFNVIGNWFKILFVENEGMAFGWAFGGKVGKLLLSLFRIGLCTALVLWIRSMCRKNDAARRDGQAAPIPAGVLVGLTLITAGAFGNIIDSLFYGIIWNYAPFLFGKVVDMFYFPLWTWPDWVPLLGGNIFFEPVFNFADSCVTVGAFYLILFQWKFFAKSED